MGSGWTGVAGAGNLTRLRDGRLVAPYFVPEWADPQRTSVVITTDVSHDLWVRPGSRCRTPSRELTAVTELELYTEDLHTFATIRCSARHAGSPTCATRP